MLPRRSDFYFAVDYLVPVVDNVLIMSVIVSVFLEPVLDVNILKSLERSVEMERLQDDIRLRVAIKTNRLPKDLQEAFMLSLEELVYVGDDSTTYSGQFDAMSIEDLI